MMRGYSRAPSTGDKHLMTVLVPSITQWGPTCRE